MKYKITLLFIFFLGNFFAQNLVKNPSFEDYNHCPYRIGYFSDNVQNWSIPNNGTTDYYNRCKTERGVKNIKNYNGFQDARIGKGYAGIYVFAEKNYREYVQGELKKPLTTGEEYTVTFYVSLGEKSTLSISNIDILFTEEKLKKCYHSNKCEKNIKPKKATNKNFFLLEKEENYFYENTLGWAKISFKFIASGFEHYFSIGNFKSNGRTNKKRIQQKIEYDYAYYYIDDVSVISSLVKKELPKTKKPLEIKKETPLVAQKIYTFKNVLFDFDKAILLSNSIEELDKLYLHLQEKESLTIEIYGHTDSIGLQKRNQKLSTERAKAVSDYLILKGLKPDRIKWFGFGSSKPKVDNISEDNRAQNRRVEFKLISK